ncbi:MAG: hypothetical protein ACI837_003500 [Crocinitomicaceae bacterium]|jgi:uncharacterized protein YkwD
MLKKLTFVCFLLIAVFSSAQLTTQNVEQLRLELSEKINSLRISKGLSALLVSEPLKKAAILHSAYMVKSKVLSHDEKSSRYRTPYKRVRSQKGKAFELVGENILYSTPQKFPLSKKEISALAEEMFNSWKNSPGHYANMTHPEYVLGDLGFKTDLSKKIVYATQVFGTKGVVIPNQISPNAFGIVEGPENCADQFSGFSNLVMNIGNSLSLEGSEITYSDHNIDLFKKILWSPVDGMAVDLISRDQLMCNQPNRLDFSPVYDGIMLKPVYSMQMLGTNEAESDYHLITEVAEIPEQFLDKDISASVILLKNGKKCMYLVPAYVPSAKYPLKPIEPKIHDVPEVSLSRKGVVRSETLVYDFNTSSTDIINLPRANGDKSEVHSIQINSYSSVEGDSVKNSVLHNARALKIKNHVKQSFFVEDNIINIKAGENWDLMNFQLHYFHREDLAALDHDSLKSFLVHRDTLVQWDSLFFLQREASATINYLGEIDDHGNQSLGEVNLRTAVAMNDIKLANKALYALYQEFDHNPTLLFEPTIFAFFSKHPECVTNYSALVSRDVSWNLHSSTRFIFNWMERLHELDDDARFNLLHMYTLVGTLLLDRWDVSSERLSNVLHPRKVNVLTSVRIEDELLLNLHLTFIEYFGQVNEGENLEKSFNYIAEHFKKYSLSKEDDVDLVLFFNNWSMYAMTYDFLSARNSENELNEDGLFALIQTTNFLQKDIHSEKYLALHKKASKLNKFRWCSWIYLDFQILRNTDVKRLYCETCDL